MNTQGEVISIPPWRFMLPAGCLYCDGTEYDPRGWPELFAAIGYYHGHGSGDNFLVPNRNDNRGQHYVIRAYSSGGGASAEK